MVLWKNLVFFFQISNEIDKFSKLPKKSSFVHENSNKLRIVTKDEILSNHIIRIFALNKNNEKILFRLQITLKTKIFEIIEIVLKEIKETLSTASNSADLLSNFTDNDVNNYCIIAIIGLRKRILRNNLEILKLNSSPWLNANLYICNKNFANFIIKNANNHSRV